MEHPKTELQNLDADQASVMRSNGQKSQTMDGMDVRRIQTNDAKRMWHLHTGKLSHPELPQISQLR